MSLVLVYAGTPTIFANFRTSIRLYFAIFHSYIALLHRTSTSQLYVAALHRSPMSQFYLAVLHRIAPYVASQPTSHRIAPRSIASPLPRVTPRDMSGARTISEVFRHSLPPMSDPVAHVCALD